MPLPQSSVPPIVFTPTGLVLPVEADILTGVQADMDAAFGGNLNDQLDTPQGQLASSQTAIIANKNAQIAAIANLVNPAFSSGRWQDAIGYIYFLERLPAQSTVVPCLCVGLAGVIIPVGALAIDQLGNKYACTQAGVIPVGGSITLSFACLTTGPIVCPANTLNAIYQAIPGWNTINNAADGVVGNNVESPQAFETRRAASVALNSTGSLPSIKAAVLAVPGVLDCYATENNTSSPVTTLGVTIGANSIYVAAVGGLASDVAEAIWLKKSTGSNYTGTTMMTVYDTVNYSPPYPAYAVSFQIPAALPIFFAVTLAANSMLPSNITALVQAAIVSAFSGGDGGSRAKIGATLYASRFYPPIAAIDPNVEIVSIFIGTAATPTDNSVTVNINQVPTISAGNITVATV